MKLNLFDNIKGVDESKYHPKYLFIKNDPQMCYIRQMLVDWTEGFVDRDGKIVREFQETFHSSFWEIYLYKLLTSAGYKLDQTHPMPDFIINYPFEIYIEAVIANIKKTGRKEEERTLNDQLSMFTPPHLQKDFYELLDNAILRYSNSINYKHNKLLKEYNNLEWINTQNPFVFAFASFDDVNYGREYIYPMLALLYGMYFDPNKNIFIPKEYIIKPETGAKIPIGLFKDKKYNNISAIIFTCSLTLGKLVALSISNKNPSLNKVYSLHENTQTNTYQLKRVGKDDDERLAEGIFIFHNPNAINKLPDNFFNNVEITNFFYENNGIDISGNYTPLISRINTSFPLNEYIEPIIYEKIREYNRMAKEEFYE